MKKNSTVYTLLCVFAALVVIAIVIIFSPNRARLTEDTLVVIPKGSSVGEISDILKDEGVISGKLSFVANTILSGKKSDLKYGDFTFSPKMSYKEVINILCKKGAKRETVTVTIPEGYSAEMIIEKLTGAGLADKDKFEAAMAMDYDYEFLKTAKINPGCKYKLQGFLFPSTYEFYKDAKAEDIINIMLQEFEKQYKSLEIGYENIYEIITKAALIEREAKLDSEREKIAGVIENRIKQDMKLQIDASVVYAISDGLYDVERVYYKDLEVDSPYNTYKYKGLPIGPICNPGVRSIEAANNPEHHEYLYYHTDTKKNDGSHIFSKTFEEHKQ